MISSYPRGYQFSWLHNTYSNCPGTEMDDPSFLVRFHSDGRSHKLCWGKLSLVVLIGSDTVVPICQAILNICSIGHEGMYATSCFLTPGKSSKKTTAGESISPSGEVTVIVFCEVHMRWLSNCLLNICTHAQDCYCCHSQLKIKRKFFLQWEEHLLQMFTTIQKKSDCSYSITEQWLDIHRKEIRYLFYLLEIQENCRRPLFHS